MKQINLASKNKDTVKKQLKIDKKEKFYTVLVLIDGDSKYLGNWHNLIKSVIIMNIVKRKEYIWMMAWINWIVFYKNY